MEIGTNEAVYKKGRTYEIHPYRIYLVQKLNEYDFECTLQDPIFLNTPFGDECSFYPNGSVNQHNCQYWADSYQRVFH